MGTDVDRMLDVLLMQPVGTVITLLGDRSVFVKAREGNWHDLSDREVFESRDVAWVMTRLSWVMS